MCQVSVIIPVYGVEKWLPACLDSVLSQSLKELEILAIDDASPDGSGRFCGQSLSITVYAVGACTNLQHLLQCSI